MGEKMLNMKLFVLIWVSFLFCLLSCNGGDPQEPDFSGHFLGEIKVNDTIDGFRIKFEKNSFGRWEGDYWILERNSNLLVHRCFGDGKIVNKKRS